MFNAQFAHIGSIELGVNAWLWSVVYEKPNGANDGLYSVQALAVDPQGLNLAVYAGAPLSVNTLVQEQVYIFLLDVATGAQNSILLQMTYTDKYHTASSSSMLLQDDGRLLFVLNQ